MSDRLVILCGMCAHYSGPTGRQCGRGPIPASGRPQMMPTAEAAIAFPDQVDFGDFRPGRFGHFYEQLTGIQPIPWKGAQGFFFASLPNL